MFPRQNLPPDFKEWLLAVKTELKDRIPDDLSAQRRAKLLTEMLEIRPADLIAEEVLMDLPDSLLEEVADWPAQTLLHCLFLRVNDCLMDHMAQGITEWHGEKVLELAEKGSISLRALRTPAETARWLSAKMADESPGGMFCRPGESAVACPDKVERSIYRIADTAALMIFIKTKKPGGLVH